MHDCFPSQQIMSMAEGKFHRKNIRQDDWQVSCVPLQKSPTLIQTSDCSNAKAVLCQAELGKTGSSRPPQPEPEPEACTELQAAPPLSSAVCRVFLMYDSPSHCRTNALRPRNFPLTAMDNLELPVKLTGEFLKCVSEWRRRKCQRHTERPGFTMETLQSPRNAPLCPPPFPHSVSTPE